MKMGPEEVWKGCGNLERAVQVNTWHYKTFSTSARHSQLIRLIEGSPLGACPAHLWG